MSQNIVNVDGSEVGEDIASIESFLDTNETISTQDSQMLKVIVSWVKENSTVGEFHFCLFIVLNIKYSHVLIASLLSVEKY